ncbi:MAG: alginate lyase family protein [Bacteroidetes bacterium]|nr:alginate lyase family protein [Bacteroidota bacterium]MBS1755646.1 alginate lyase family protein [Bacteroidota bacterium]
MKLKFLISFLALVITAFMADAGSKPVVYSLNMQRLQKSKSAILNKEEDVMPAYKKLLKDADKAMQFEPVSVMAKINIPPSGDKHDYMSLAPYFWPDSSKADGLPYIRKDGQTNPEVKVYKDKEYMPALCDKIFTLSLAYYFSGNGGYAQHAATLIKVWFINPATKMNPNLNYAQAIKGVNEGRGAGLIDARHFIKVIDAIGLMQDSKYWTKKNQTEMKIWFASFLQWMQTSKNGKSELHADNNHGVWYDALRLAIALYTNNNSAAKDIINNAKNRLDMQLDDAGSFPKEMERTISLHYTCFVLQAFFNIAEMAGKLDVDFWNYTSPGGKSLKKAFDALSPYLLGNKNWEGQQIKDFDKTDAYPLLLDGANKYHCNNCRNAVALSEDGKGKRSINWLLY